MSRLKGISRVAVVIVIAAVIVSGAIGYFIAEMTRPPPTVLPTVELKVTVRSGVWSDLVEELEIVSKFKEKMESERGVDVKVWVDKVPSKGFSERVTADFAAGVAGDVVHVPHALLASYVEAEYLLDVTAYVNEWLEWDQYYPIPMEMGSYKGKRYMILWDTSTKHFWYRKDLFESAGITVPWQPKNWEEIKSTVKTLKDKLPSDVIPIWYMHHDFHYTFLRAAGGKLYDPADGKWIVKSPQLLEMFKLFYDLAITYDASSPQMYFEKWDRRKMFAEGKLAILADGCYCWGEKWGPGMAYEMPNRDEVVGWAMVPGTGEPGAMIYASLGSAHGWAIDKKTEHPDLAWELLKMLAGKEMTAIYNARTTHVSPRKDAVQVEEYADNAFLADVTDEMMEYIVYRPEHPDIAKVFDVLDKVSYDYLLTGEKDPAGIMDEFARLVEAKVGKENVKTIT